MIDAGVDAEKVVTVPNAVDVNRFMHSDRGAARVRSKYGIEPNSPVIGFAGTFGFWHGIDILADAIQELEIGRDPQCTYLLVGDGPYRRECESKLQQFDNVIFTGLVPYSEMVDYLSACGVLLSPHNVPRGEKFIGSPTKLYEYMAMEKVIIASDLDQIGEVLEPALTVGEDHELVGSVQDAVAIKIPPGDSMMLAQAIETVLKEWARLQKTGENARRKVCLSHSWDHAVKMIVAKL